VSDAITGYGTVLHNLTTGELAEVKPVSFEQLVRPFPNESHISGILQIPEPATFRIDFANPEAENRMVFTEALVEHAGITHHDGCGYPRRLKKALRKRLNGRPLGRKERLTTPLMFIVQHPHIIIEQRYESISRTEK